MVALGRRSTGVIPPSPAASAQPTLISIDNVSFKYPGGVQALQGVSLDIPRNEITGIVGPSGCGKTSLLRIIAGLLRADHGTVHANFERSSDARHRITMVSQVDTLLPWLKVRDNVALFYRYHPAPKRAIDERVDELLAMVGLRDFAKAYPRQLSGGMRRRVAFLAAIAPNPQLLLLDEPFASVDEPTRVGIHHEIFRILADSGTTTVLVTHDLAEAISLSHQVMILSARPAHVDMRVAVPFGAHRAMAELREQPEFLELYGALWSHLRRQISASTNQ